MRTLGIVAITAALFAAVIYALHNAMPGVLAGMLPNVTAQGAVSVGGPYQTAQPDISGSQVAQDTSVTTPTQLEGSAISPFVSQRRVTSSRVTIPVPPAAAFNAQPTKFIQPASFSGYHVPIVTQPHTAPSYAKAASTTIKAPTTWFSSLLYRASSPSAGVRNTSVAKYRPVWTPELNRPTPVARGTITGTATKAAASTPGDFSPKTLHSIVTPQRAPVIRMAARRKPTGPITGTAKISVA